MSSLYSELTNLFDQDFMNGGDGNTVLEWLIRHREEIDNIEIDYLNDISISQDKIADLEAKLEESEEVIKSNSHNKWLKAEAERYKSEYQSLKGYIDQLKQQLEETEELNKKLAEHSQSVDKALDDSCDVIRNLKQQLAEERKKVVQEIRDKISDGIYQNSYGETFIDGDIYEILDQIERGV